MYQGSKTCLLDDKNRFKLPATFRNKLDPKCENHFVIIKAPLDDCLYLYPANDWIDFRDNQLKGLSTGKAGALRKKIMGTLSEIDMDKTGRMLIPQEKLASIGVESTKELLIFGDINKFQIWNIDTFNSEADLTEDDIKDVLDDISF